MAPSNDTLLRRLDLLLRTGCLLMVNISVKPDDQNGTCSNSAMVRKSRPKVNLSADGETITKFLRVERHGINLDILREVSRLTWEAAQKDFFLGVEALNVQDLNADIVKSVSTLGSPRFHQICKSLCGR